MTDCSHKETVTTTHHSLTITTLPSTDCCCRRTPVDALSGTQDAAFGRMMQMTSCLTCHSQAEHHNATSSPFPSSPALQPASHTAPSTQTPSFTRLHLFLYTSNNLTVQAKSKVSEISSYIFWVKYSFLSVQQWVKNINQSTRQPHIIICKTVNSKKTQVTNTPSVVH